MKLSIITICYNEPNLEKTCESIVNQTWQDFEWIVIDGGSNKETLDIFEKYKHRINKFISEPDKGIYNAYNKGIKLATGEYINFINSGDSYYNISVLVEIFKNRHLIEDIIYGEQMNIFTDNKKNYVTKLPETITKEHFINSNIHTPAIFIKRELFDKYGLFDESYKIASDRERWICFAENNVIFKHINMVVANFDKNGISSCAEFTEQHQAEIKRMLEKHFTQQEIKSVLNQKYSFFEQIFSIKNNSNKTHKIITILGLHIKVRKKSVRRYRSPNSDTL